MLSIREIEHHFDYLPAEAISIMLELRNLVCRIAPDAAEVIHRYGITYYHANRGGPVSAGICQILTHDDHIELAFIHGAFLPDPAGILRGDRKVKRSVYLDSYDMAPWAELEKLIEAHSRFNPYTQTFLSDNLTATKMKMIKK